MRLWMIAHEDLWHELQRAGELRADPERAWDEFRTYYD